MKKRKIDSQGFVILTGFAQVGKFAQLLLDSTPKKNAIRHKKWLKKQKRLSLKRQPVDFGKFIFPVFKNILPDLILPDIISVQPLKTITNKRSTFKFDLLVAPKEEILPAVASNELLFEYKYGGILSERGGWFVVNKKTPNRVLRYRQDWLS